MEDFSNELFYEIFDYFDGIDLYHTFSRLNQRLEELISSVLLRFRIPFSLLTKSSNFHESYHSIVVSNKHRVLSFAITDIWLAQHLPPTINLIDASFQRLESLLLCGFKIDNLIPFLLNLTTLPRLSSLTIYASLAARVYKNIYQAIFSLPMLKYNKIETNFNSTEDSHSNENEYPITPLQYLNMGHAWSLADLMSMCASTPELCRLRCAHLDGSIPIDHLAIKLPQLTHLTIDHCQVSFIDLEKFIQTISSPVQFLQISIQDEMTYLNPNRWERLINQQIPELRVLNFTYQELNDDEFHLTNEHLLIQRFTSSFWIKRQWLLDLTMDIVEQNSTEMTYSIRPYK